MKIFSYCYDKVMVWAKHPRATYYLAGLSVAESIFFPIPVDAMLAPMALSQTQKALFFATIATIGSVLGGVIGYYLGYLAFEPIVLPAIELFGYQDAFSQVSKWLKEWGFWVIFVAGFSPIPYKIFTIGAGAFGLGIVPFVVASIISRGARYFLVAGLMMIGGEKMEAVLRRYVDQLGWLVVLAVIAYMLLQL